ncbi:MAG: tRNA (N6-isopentenyl adenosine(37)-C2)-methylthiotransferase MiaB [Candidatus Zipacnadales bacterium]
MHTSFYIETFGCQMNEHDSEGIAGILTKLGMSPAQQAAEADVIVLNTCSVREKPHRKVFARLEDYRALKEERPERLIVVAGCMAQLIPEEIRTRAPHVDLIIGPTNYPEFEAAVNKLLDRRGKTQVLLNRCKPDMASIPFARADRFRAWVTVTEGCDNYCAYCVVPYARGPEVSRRPEAIIEEITRLVQEGTVEVTLLGQNVNSYGRGLIPELSFPELLSQVDSIPSLRRVRFTTSHPKDLSPQLIQAMAHLPTVCEHLHLPIQAGSDRVLERMGRGHTAQDYLRLVNQAREAIPDLALTTDVMVGFPGETEEDFECTLALFEQVRYDQAFMFKYNDRPGTLANDFPDKVPEVEKQRRLEALVAAQNRIAREINEGEVGKVFEVLVEGRDPKDSTKARGRTRQNKLMIFPASEDLTGQFVWVRAQQARLWGWLGEQVRTET